MQIISPITNKSNVTKVRSLNVNWIVDQWKKQFNYDVNYLFKGLGIIDLYECNDTGYMFFKPDIEGDSNLYGRLQNISWYYMPWKWEHEVAAEYLEEEIEILEIGCAEGDFLERIREQYHLNATGIETNPLAIKRAREKGLTIYEESIEEHHIRNELRYDIIVSFQVLEHIADVKSFIEACLACLKSRGILIISVPNNLSFISEYDHLLNMPPHHVGLWDERSLKALASNFRMTVESIIKEPLQEYHKEFFKSTVYTRIFGRGYTNRISGRLLRFLFLRPFIDKHIEYFSKWVSGHTIIATYRKN
jgi:2-polyprenyl-3-methyl-5-hydroxy-6-metoxy-1,4-benzoquinol methylase